ncbi:MAG: PHP domain-containing protein [Euryarchaeota archaeon]|nr:PHP domain-containing protein [Euryarchaeota archaeon]
MKFDLHIHTIYSPDGRNRVQDVIDILRSKGFAGAAITDHNSPEGGREALELDPEGFIVIPGIEVSSDSGHILALNVTEPIERGMSVIDTIDAIHAKGGIAIAAHPYRYWSGLGEENVIGRPFDAVEVLNARSNHVSNDKAVDLARILKKPVTGGSDSHENATLGAGYTEVPDGCDAADKVIKAIMEGRSGTDGSSRTVGHTLQYVSKSVSQWVGRGMKRM